MPRETNFLYTAYTDTITEPVLFYYVQHVTIEVDLGQRNVTRYHLSETDLAEFILNTASINIIFAFI